jgi:hypothetical protein
MSNLAIGYLMPLVVDVNLPLVSVFGIDLTDASTSIADP